MAALDIAALLPKGIWDRFGPALAEHRRYAVLAGGALAAALVVVALAWSWSGSYSVLYAGLSAEEGGRAIGELQKLNIPYRTAESGRVILVPSDDLGRARLELASRGVPKRDGDQWALLDNESLGVSPFVEQVHYLRAAESALSQTIREIDGIVAATVKLGVPKQTDFLADSPKPSASVMIRLRPGFQLGAAQVEGIAGLVAASVPGMSRDNVTIVDQTGKVLNQKGQDELQQVPAQLAVARDVERRYEASLTDLLVPALGRGNFRVSVDAELDFSRSKESSIRYGAGHVLSEQSDTVHAHGGNGEAIGIPGALSNRPPENPTIAAPQSPAPANPASAATGTEQAAQPAAPADKKPTTPQPDIHKTTNYDLDHTVKYLEHPLWSLRSLNVAVLINHPAGKTEPSGRIDAIKKLVSSAIGTGEDRRIAVVDLPFEDTGGGLVGSPSLLSGRWAETVEQNALFALAGLALLFGGLWPLLRRIEAAALPGGGSVAAASGAAPEISELRRSGSGGSGFATVRRPANRPDIVADPEAVRTLVINEPDRTAQVIKEWIARDRNRLKRAS